MPETRIYNGESSQPVWEEQTMMTKMTAKMIGTALSAVVVAAALIAALAGAFAREVAPFEGLLFWKAGILALVVLGFRLAEHGTPSTASVLGNSLDD